jgi:hypothetical protein
MNQEQRILQYLQEALGLIQDGHTDHVAILGRLDNAAIAASLRGWADLRESIGEAEEQFILGRYAAAAGTISTAVAEMESAVDRQSGQGDTAA